MAAHSHELSGVVTSINFIANEIPSGDIDSINKVFILAYAPMSGTVQVHLNGMVQTPGSGLDYTLSGTTITFTKAPRTNSEILIHYIKS